MLKCPALPSNTETEVRLALDVADKLEADGVQVDWITVLAWAKHVRARTGIADVVGWFVECALVDHDCFESMKRDLLRLQSDADVRSKFVDHVLEK